ncbi:MAG: ABC transporter permease [Clostridium septicum]|uniref:ABC transporter permease n=3 Tax=Clostridium septicum TaxID=1504 RepID=UPI000832560E|nr:ABC transporter permease [Clostridium septicum]MDU1312627.1 ABC transporter permease [Clostridium septicum]
MSNLFSLLKANFINSIGINKILKEKRVTERYKSIFILVSMVVVAILLVYVGIKYFSLIADVLEASGNIDILLCLVFLASTAFIFFTSIYKAQGVLFSVKGLDMLMSLPITSTTILASKVINLLLLNYLLLIFVLIPPALVYFSRVDLSYLFFIYLFVGLIFMPLTPVIIASIIAFILSYIATKVKFKNLVLNIGTFAFFIGIMAISFKLQHILNSILINSKSIIDAFKKIYPPAYYFSQGVTNLDIKSLSMFIILSIIPFIIFLAIFNKVFKNINSKLGESFKKSNYKLIELKASSPIKALLKKEIKRYFSSSIYVVNTLVGLVLITMFSISCLLFGRDILELILKIQVDKEMIPLALIVFLSGAVSLSCTTQNSISIEGKNLWILKSLPLEVMDIFKGKIGLNLMILIPTIFINAVILIFTFNLSLVNMIWVISIPIIYSILISIIGLIINLYFPKFDWISEVTVVKQSLSSFLGIFIGMILVFIPIGIFIVFNIECINIYLSVVAGCLIGTIVLSLFILNTKGVELFNKL